MFVSSGPYFSAACDISKCQLACSRLWLRLTDLDNNFPCVLLHYVVFIYISFGSVLGILFFCFPFEHTPQLNEEGKVVLGTAMMVIFLKFSDLYLTCYQLPLNTYYIFWWGRNSSCSSWIRGHYMLMHGIQINDIFNLFTWGNKRLSQGICTH